MAFLRSRWERFRLLLSKPNTKISKILNNSEVTEGDIIVLIMGEANKFQNWFEDLKDIYNPNLYLVFASLDTEVVVSENANTIINDNKNENHINNHFLDYHTIYIPGKSWTEGRNALAAEALKKERLRGKEFSYWFFLDDDVEPICHPATDKVYGAKCSCWQKVFNFLTSEAVPEKASTVVLPSYLKDGFVATSNVNGYNAAIKRNHVPYLLPYATLQPGFSEWISQAANMCIIGSCMANSVVFVPLIYSSNTKDLHSSGLGYTIDNIHSTIVESFHDTNNNFTPCNDWDGMKYYSEGEFSGLRYQLLGPFSSSEELNQHMSYTNTSYCSVPLHNRFTRWEETFLPLLPDPFSLRPKIEDDITVKNRHDKNIVVMVMGDSSSFQAWKERLQDIVGVNLTFLFAYCDAEVTISPNNSNSGSDRRLNFQALYINKQTWTEGRNLLAGEALRTEKLQGKEFDYWLFIDDDVEPVCHAGSEKILGTGSCWQQIFNFVSGDTVPEKASTIALPLFVKDGYASTSSADAIFAAFKRESVPYLIPYATLLKGSDEGISQAANICIMSTCLPNSGVYIPYVTANNIKSLSHTREGFSIQIIHATITLNYHNATKNFIPCHDWDTIAFYEQGEEGQSYLGPFQTADALDQHIPSHQDTFCSPLLNRFMEWEQNVFGIL